MCVCVCMWCVWCVCVRACVRARARALFDWMCACGLLTGLFTSMPLPRKKKNCQRGSCVHNPVQSLLREIVVIPSVTLWCFSSLALLGITYTHASPRRFFPLERKENKTKQNKTNKNSVMFCVSESSPPQKKKKKKKINSNVFFTHAQKLALINKPTRWKTTFGNATRK